MKISICSYTFNQQTRAGTMSAFGYLDNVTYRYGLPAADFWHGTFASLEPDYLAKVKDALAEQELSLSNVCIDRAHIWEDDADARAANHRNALANIAAAEFLGAETVRVDAGGKRDEDSWTAQQLDVIVKQYREWAQRAYDNGYRIGPENHWGAETVPASFKALCEAVDHPGFGVVLHAGRWRGDDAARGDAMLTPWAMHTHFSPAVSPDELLATMNGLRAAGYQGCYSVEVSTLRLTEPAVIIAQIRDVGERWRQGE
jgi:sugar phosphate isomerase/epimerase